MSKQELTSDSCQQAPEGLSAAETRLGQVLALIHRVLPRLEEPSRASDVQRSLRNAAALLELARQAHEGGRPAVAAPPGSPQAVATSVEPEIAAVIAAAVAVLFNRPYRLVSVQQVSTPVPHLNVWALEGRTQIFQSHKIR
jgi:hypothetical protein